VQFSPGCETPLPGDILTKYDTHNAHKEVTDDCSGLHENMGPNQKADLVPATEVEALRKVLQNLQAEMQENIELFHRCLASERQLCASAVQQANDAACILRDANIELSGEVDILRGRVEELEMELTSVTSDKTRETFCEEGNEQFIAVLQVEIADLERQLQRAQRSRTASGEAEAAATQRSEILAQQVEQMAKLLESEREENLCLKKALQAR